MGTECFIDTDGISNEDSNVGDPPVPPAGWLKRYVKTVGGFSHAFAMGDDGIPQLTKMPREVRFVLPGEDIQAAINSIPAGTGGAVILLPGVHIRQTSLLISIGSVRLMGYGYSSVIACYPSTDPTNPWLGTETADDALINVGTPDGLNPIDGVTVEHLALMVGADIHGIQFNGGLGNKLCWTLSRSTAPKTSVRCGCVMTDSVAARGESGHLFCVCFDGDIFANGWTDGFHIDGSAPFVGQTFGYGNGCVDYIVHDNQVKYGRETLFLLCSCLECTVAFCSSREGGHVANVIGMGLVLSDNNVIDGNTMAENQNAVGVIGLYVYTSNYNRLVQGVINGNAFAYATGIYFLVNSDYNTAELNLIRNAVQGVWVSAGCDENRIMPNKFGPAVTTHIVDNATITYYQGVARTYTANPNGVITGYLDDTIYDTIGGQWYKCTSKPRGTAWVAI